jgi:hypothetical protein
MSNELRTIIVGNKKEVERVQDLLVKSKARSNYLGYVSLDANTGDSNCIGNVNQLGELVELMEVEEIIFCSKDLASASIIAWMGKISSADVLFKIVPEESLFIIGSSNKNTPGDFYTIEINLQLAKDFEQQKKRVFDLGFSLLLIPFIPLLVLFIKPGFNLISNIFNVLAGRKTWVGYAQAENIKLLPHIKHGILSPVDAQGGKAYNPITIQKLNFLYAKDYSVEKDFLIVMRSIRSWGK